MWNPWRGCKKCCDGCLHCYIHKGDLKRNIDTNKIQTKDLTKQARLANINFKCNNNKKNIIYQKDGNMKSIEKVIKETTEENQENVNWTKVQSTKYPILKSYQKEVDIPKYAKEIRRMLTELQETYNYSKLDAMLVLKDILAHEYLDKK